MSALLNEFLKHKQVSTDSRNLPDGCIYFALKGERFNGNDFALDALSRGAALAVVDEDRNWQDSHILRVPNVLNALQELALEYRKTWKFPVVGLTGSNGKTTSKELMAAALGTVFNVRSTAGNLNNHIGVPLTLLSVKPEHNLAIIEMGANHRGEIAQLSALAQPDYGYITNYGKAHLEGFGGVQGVIEGKSELYQNLRSNGKTALVNITDPIQMERTRGMDRITFGPTETADYPVFPLTGNGRIGITAEGLSTWSNLTGAYNIGNLSAAYAIARHLGGKTADIFTALSAYEPRNNRSQLSETDNNRLILDCYNANPSSMQVALENLAAMNHPSKLAILGDMFELGEYSTEEHQRMADLARDLGIDTLLVGEAFGTVNTRLPVFENLDRLKTHLGANPPKNRLILLKGSRGMALENLVPLL